MKCWLSVLYLVFNLLQECGLERAVDPAFSLKHEDNMKKQHETVTWRVPGTHMLSLPESLRRNWRSLSPELKEVSGSCAPRAS